MFPIKPATPLLIFCALLLSACSTNVGKTIKVSDTQLAQYDALSKLKALGMLEVSISKARNSKMPFLAPHYFNEANEIFTGLQIPTKSSEKESWKADFAKAQTLLEKGEAISTQVRGRFSRELELKGLLDEFNASQSYPGDYKKVIEKFSDLIEIVELEKNTNIDRDKSELIKAMQMLDVKAVQYSALHESDLTIQNTQKKIDPKLAPIVLGEAQRVYADATKRIASAPHDVMLVKRAGDEATFSARRAWFITERILALQKLSLEGIALEEEKYFSDLTTAIGEKDLRDQALFNQEKIIANAAKTAIQDKAQLNASSQSTTQSLEKRLKESDAALQQCSALTTSLTNQVEMRDLQIKVLREKITPSETLVIP
ncbi:MAG: hypothetical protein ABL911_05565 [Gallionella sp.]